MAQKPTFDYDIIIIGSGAGGSPAASMAARAGKKVAIIEQDEFGGESPNWGEVPLGAMLNVANTYDTAKKAANFGLRTAAIGYNYPSILLWRDTVVKRTGAAGNRRYYEKQSISTFNGTAHFLSPNEISINRRHLSARKFLIATGTTWEIPDIPGIAETPYFTPKDILTLTRPPKTLFIIGSTPAAIEIASLMSIFGTKVYLADSATRIMPDQDEDVSEMIASQLTKQRGMTIMPNTKIVAVQKEGIYRRITFVRAGVERTIKVDALMIADRRAPATDIGLENAGVAYNSQGIKVNASLQTSSKHIFAAGSCVHPGAATHEILMHSRVAAHNLLHTKFSVVDKHMPLQVIRSVPEIARVGLSEDDCIRRDLKINRAVVPITIAPRSNITDDRIGMVKLISDKKGTLLGAAIVAPNASEMIHELAIAISHGLSAEDLFSTPHEFTSWSETIRIAAGKLL
jgi:pyruvate/2-oxoglutarate dehydrogenase complex dihydrolipoamide dehydrogenase (E3) component